MISKALARTIVSTINREIGHPLVQEQACLLSNVVANLITAAFEQEQQNLIHQLGDDYETGFAAYQSGEPMDRNPHTTGSIKSVYWERGWLDGLNDRKNYW